MFRLAFLLILASACSAIGPLDLRDTPTFALSELKQGADPVAEKAKRGEPFIVQVKQGDEVPIKVALDIPGLTFLACQNAVRFDRDVFVHFGAGQMHVSADGQTWAPMGDFKAIAKLFGLGHGGTFQVGAGVSRPDGPFVTVKIGAK